jgi:hypothetical protein
MSERSLRRAFVFSKKKNRSGIATLLIVAIVVIVVAVAVGVTYILYFNPSTSGGIGTSSIALAQTSGSVAAGNTMSVSYTVSLASGTKWGTTLVVANNSTLKGEGITVTPSTSAMDPTYTGTLSIAVASSATPGSYQINLKATGDDPSSSNAVFTLTVTTASSSSSTTTSSSSTTTTTSSSSCTGLYC